MSTFLSTFLPSQYEAQYWFINGSQDYYELDEVFRPLDFLYIDSYNSCFLDEEEVEELRSFLLEMDSKRVQWLLYIPATDTVKQLFSRFHLNEVLDSKPFSDNIKLLCITNYPVPT